jgi:DNA-binding NarL/FixJ family response regulator
VVAGDAVTRAVVRAGRLRILIVDDHAGFRLRARSLLEDGGLEVVGEAADGAGCLAAVAALRPDGVVLDVRLPDGDGFRVAEQLAALHDAPLVVLVSSRALADFGPRRLASCVRGFVGKSELSAQALRALLGP